VREADTALASCRAAHLLDTILSGAELLLFCRCAVALGIRYKVAETSQYLQIHPRIGCVWERCGTAVSWHVASGPSVMLKATRLVLALCAAFKE